MFRAGAPTDTGLIAGADRQAADVPRSYAMMLLMVTYGLRGCDVRSLHLNDYVARISPPV
jgi:hypothetical protein